MNVSKVGVQADLLVHVTDTVGMTFERPEATNDHWMLTLAHFDV